LVAEFGAQSIVTSGVGVLLGGCRVLGFFAVNFTAEWFVVGGVSKKVVFVYESDGAIKVCAFVCVQLDRAFVFGV
jgi:hypothetical protein